jgi:predicted ATPase/DNA-binding CsgD family transcriptional regulator
MTREHVVPVALSPLIGRADERADVLRLLGETRLLTLLGAGGSGKTRLAQEVAVAATPEHPDGALWVDLAGVRDPSMVTAALATAAGVQERRSQDLVDTLAGHLRDRRSLVVLDGCEHLVEACASLLSRVLPGCPSLTVLATSREALAVDGEVGYVVPPLPVPGPAATTAVEVSAADAARLFEQRARQVRTGFRIDDDNAVSVAEICRRLDGIPLAIELAAARVRVLAPAQIADALSDRFALLTGGGRGAPTRQRTLESSVEWSYDLLDDDQRRLLVRLAAFAGSFELQAAEALAGDDGLGRNAVLDLLTDLVDRSLLQLVPSGDTSRYRLLETIRLYAWRRLPELDDPVRVRNRHLSYYVDLADQARHGLNAPDPRPWLLRLGTELDDLRAAMDWAVESGQPLAVLDLAEPTFSFWVVRGLYEEMRRRLAAAVAAPGIEDAGRARGLATASILTLMGGDHRSGHDFASQAAPLASETGDELTLARALTFRAWCGYLSGEATSEDVRSDIDASLSLAERLDDRELLARALLYAGTLGATGAGTFQEGRTLIQRALAEMDDAGLTYLTVPGRAFLANVLVLPGGELAEARAQARTALEEGRRIGLGSFVALSLGTLGLADAVAGDESSARGHFEEALRVARDGALPGFEMVVRSRLALVEHRFGHTDRARHGARAALQAAQEAGARADHLGAEWLLGVLALQTGDHAAAEAHLTRARDLAREPRYPSELGRSLLGLAHLRRDQGELDEAWELAHEALEVLAGFGDRPGTLDALEGVGGLAIALDRAEPGLRLLSATDRIRDATGLGRFPLEAATHARDVDAARSRLGARPARACWAGGSDLSLDDAVAYARRGRGDRSRPKLGWSSLTPSEQDVVRLVANGCSNSEIAEQLFMSVNTVKTHLRHVYEKLQVTGRADLAARAARRDL